MAFFYTDKEVEGYYEDDMRILDYVTLLWTDDKYVDVLDFEAALLIVVLHVT